MLNDNVLNLYSKSDKYYMRLLGCRSLGRELNVWDIFRNYFEHFTIGQLDGSDFKTLKYPDLVIDGRHSFRLQPGFYRITVTTRQIDGTASVSLWHLSLSADQEMCIPLPEDQTPRCLCRRVPSKRSLQRKPAGICC